MDIRNLILCVIFITLGTSCTPSKVRENQSTAAGNIYEAALAIELGADPRAVTPSIKRQALLIIQSNKDTLRGVAPLKGDE